MQDIDTMETSTAPATSESRPAPSRKAKRGVGALWGVAIVIVLVVGAGVAYHYGLLPGGATSTTGGSGSTDPDAVVATVNGVAITRAELNKKTEQVVAQYGLSAEQSQDAAFELQVLDEVINLHLLLGEAQQQGITVTDEEVNNELANVTEAMGGEDALNTQLETVGLTRDELLTNMRNELVIRKLLDANTELASVTASDEEVAKLYEDAKEQAAEGQEVPPLADVSEMARAQIIQQKSGDIVQKYIDGLRASATIERKL